MKMYVKAADDPIVEHVTDVFEYDADFKVTRTEGYWEGSISYKHPSYGIFDTYSNAKCEGRFDDVNGFFYSLGSDNAKGLNRRNELFSCFWVHMMRLIPSSILDDLTGSSSGLNISVKWDESPDSQMFISVKSSDGKALCSTHLSGQALWDHLTSTKVSDQMFVTGKSIAATVIHDMKSNL